MLLSLVSCTVTPPPRVAELDIPTTWSEKTDHGQETKVLLSSLWWTTFNDPVLTSLIDQGVTANRDLREATARVRETRALRTVAASDRWPQIGSGASYTRSLGSSNTISSSFSGSGQGTGDDSTSTNGTSSSSGNSFGIGEERDFFQTRFDASWELDIFGRVHWSVKAAEADIAAAQENRRNVLVSLLAEIARNYIELRGFQHRLVIARNNIQAQQDSVDVTTERFEAGITSAQDVAQAESLLATTRSQVPTLQIGVRQSTHRLGVLIGQPPDALLDELSQAAPIPTTELDGTLGLPSDLLRRRPDIRQAERELAAATARLGVAMADLYPRFSLTGLVGLQSLDVTELISWPSRTWTIGPSVSWPVFDAGRIRANIRAQDSRQEQALARYEQAILTSLEEVENALVAYIKERVRQSWLFDAVKASREATDVASERYRSGLENFLNVVVAQRSLYDSQDALAQSEIAIASNLVALYKALGGGWVAR
jgi:NodT family efflux transporter outer membrane factor (OMF) lipoprotein